MDKVSICMITYNHGKFIAQAIESALMQKTNFDYEIVIGEDCSTDNTREIVVSYAKKYSDKVKSILNEKNIGPIPNFVKTLNMCRGKYIAMLEGDDYWTDPYKLQKQVDFLENHEDFAICFHRTKIIDELNSKTFLRPKNDSEKRVFTICDLFKGNFMHTATLVIRNGDCLKKLPEWYRNVKVGDWSLTLIAAQHGKIYYIPDIMSVYRMHFGGIHSTFNRKSKIEAAISVLEPALKFFPYRYEKHIKRPLDSLYASMLGYAMRNKNASQIRYYLNKKKALNPNMLKNLTSPLYLYHLFKGIILL